MGTEGLCVVTGNTVGEGRERRADTGGEGRRPQDRSRRRKAARETENDIASLGRSRTPDWPTHPHVDACTIPHNVPLKKRERDDYEIESTERKTEKRQGHPERVSPLS